MIYGKEERKLNIAHMAHLGISGQLKICEGSDGKLGHTVLLFSDRTGQRTDYEEREKLKETPMKICSSLFQIKNSLTICIHSQISSSVCFLWFGRY